jgi:hypothetical protein
MDEPLLLVLTGPPDAGKTTVGRSVAARFGRSACIESDWFWSTICNGFVLQWKAEADPQNRAALRSFVAAGARIVPGGYSTVVEGIVGPWYLDIVREELQSVDMAAHCVVLRPALATCLQPATGRGGPNRVPGHPPLTDEGPIRLLWNPFADVGEYEEHAVDSTDMSESQTADWIIELLDRRGPELLLAWRRPRGRRPPDPSGHGRPGRDHMSSVPSGLALNLPARRE